MSGALRLFIKEKRALDRLTRVRELRGNHGCGGFYDKCLHVFRCSVVLDVIGAFKMNFASFYLSMPSVQMHKYVKICSVQSRETVVFQFLKAYGKPPF